jgi:hypothetical protein
MILSFNITSQEDPRASSFQFYAWKRFENQQ